MNKRIKKKKNKETLEFLYKIINENEKKFDEELKEHCKKVQCLKCGVRLEYQENGGVPGEDFQEWMECPKCGCTRDLTREDIKYKIG